MRTDPAPSPGATASLPCPRTPTGPASRPTDPTHGKDAVAPKFYPTPANGSLK